ncbi:MAG: Holliday junction branch migration protein RuvA [Fimbriiglobus sp.]
MMTKLTGILTRILDEEARLEVGPCEYQILISEANRRTLQLKIGREITFHISEYYEGNQSGTRFVPRKIGFLTEQELEFFDLFCTVDKIGAKKALKAMARGVRDIADAVNRSDTKWLITLPGIGGTTAEQMITTMKRKIAPFLVRQAEADLPEDTITEPAITPTTKKPKGKAIEPTPTTDTGPTEQLIDDLYTALIGMGSSPQEARDRVDTLLRSGQKFQTHNEALHLMFSAKK